MTDLCAPEFQYRYGTVTPNVVETRSDFRERLSARPEILQRFTVVYYLCLLFTSDAAVDMQWVGVGGSRII